MLMNWDKASSDCEGWTDLRTACSPIGVPMVLAYQNPKIPDYPFSPFIYVNMNITFLDIWTGLLINCILYRGIEYWHIDHCGQHRVNNGKGGWHYSGSRSTSAQVGKRDFEDHSKSSMVFFSKYTKKSDIYSRYHLEKSSTNFDNR